MRWENSFLSLADITDVEDTERIPWKSVQSRPSAGPPASRGGVDAAGAPSVAETVKRRPCRRTRVTVTLEKS